MSSEESLSGLRVQITIDEDRTPNPPDLPLGTIERALEGKDGTTYHYVHLDQPVSCMRWDGVAWTLSDLTIAPKAEGTDLELLLSAPRGEFILVAIANVMSPMEPVEPTLDFAKVTYFALGKVKRV
jgi:hypothetical protein